ncbi:hypothetical protein [Aquabacterium parvum]|uniref:hypothetical protein n=1 Tax=Aquabacterium parvum TaxID=70584 RepID=UPI000718C6CA|nr:hypothetical protein [Aquabacterium parvum]MBU0916993.1 hypothetical protein [Gammaproteobacteria bacterium]
MARNAVPAFDIPACLAEVDAHLSALDEALASGDAERIDGQAQLLQQCLAASLASLRQGGGESLSPELVQRLMLARTRCMQQQQAVHRATASFGRTLGMLFPGESTSFAPPATNATARALQAYR